MPVFSQSFLGGDWHGMSFWGSGGNSWIALRLRSRPHAGHRGASTGERQSNRISITRVILPRDVVRQILEQLPPREATMALIDAVTALRSSELVALKWRNVGWDTDILRSESAFVEGELKDTKSRSNILPPARPVELYAQAVSAD